MSETNEKTGVRWRGWWMVAALMALYLVVRLPGLMRMPIFGDEAIYLRWAQLVRGGHWWVSLVDPKPPGHFWLIAMFLGWAKDPLMVARGLSVAAGLLTIPAIMGVCAELGRMMRGAEGKEMEPPSGWSWGLLGVVMMVVCPFMAFHQRMGLADAWFVLEAAAVVWLGLRVARGAWGMQNGESPIQRWGWVVGLGVALGAAFMTRQILSQVLMGVMAWGFLVMWQRRGRGLGAGGQQEAAPGCWKRPWHPVWKFVGAMCVAGVVAGAIWSPYFVLYPKGYHDQRESELPMTAQSIKEELRARVLYQKGFSEPMTVAQRLTQIRENTVKVFVPTGKAGAADYATGWLWVYMTPGVLLLAAAGVIWLGVRRQWRAGLFLVGWAGMMIGPVVVFGAVTFPRYALAGVLPLLLIVAYLLADATGWLYRKSKVAGWAVAVALAGVALIWPMRDLGLQASRWWAQPMVAQDRYQYVTGWPAGGATMDAVAYLRAQAKERPIVVITGEGWGTPADAVWAYLEKAPGISVYYVSGPGGPVRGAGAGKLRLREDKLLYTPERVVELPAAARVFYVSQDPVYTGKGPKYAADLLGADAVNVFDARVFANLAPPGGTKVSDCVTVFDLGEAREIGAIPER